MDLKPESAGPYILYALRKEGWTTPDAIRVICQRWKLARQRVAHAGLKDRHAQTLQHLTILHGPKRNLTHQRLQVTYLGHTHAPLAQGQLQSNRFAITVRALRPGELARAQERLPEVAAVGLPNYFDDQRFGSASAGGDFIGRALVRGQYERALELALVAPYAFDRSRDKARKRTLRQHWGRWPQALDALPRERGVSPVLRHLAAAPADFLGAFARLPGDLTGLYLSAYQSHLWNLMVGAWLRDRFAPHQLSAVHLGRADLPVLKGRVDDARAELLALSWPFVSDLAPAAELAAYWRVLADEGVRPEQFALPTDRLRFRRGERKLWVDVRDLGQESADDELHPGRLRLTLRFTLPPGAYATLVVKRLTAPT